MRAPVDSKARATGHRWFIEIKGEHIWSLLDRNGAQLEADFDARMPAFCEAKRKEAEDTGAVVLQMMFGPARSVVLGERVVDENRDILEEELVGQAAELLYGLVHRNYVDA